MDYNGDGPEDQGKLRTEIIAHSNGAPMIVSWSNCSSHEKHMRGRSQSTDGPKSMDTITSQGEIGHPFKVVDTLCNSQHLHTWEQSFRATGLRESEIRAFSHSTASHGTIDANPCIWTQAQGSRGIVLILLEINPSAFRGIHNFIEIYAMRTVVKAQVHKSPMQGPDSSAILCRKKPSELLALVLIRGAPLRDREKFSSPGEHEEADLAACLVPAEAEKLYNAIVKKKKKSR